MSEGSTATESESDLLVDVVTVVEDLIGQRGSNDFALELDREINRLQAKFQMLVAIREQLVPYAAESEAELPLAEPEPRSLANTAADGYDVESLIVQFVSKNGPSMPGVIADAIGVHATKIGRVVSKSNALAKDGKLIAVKLS